MTSESFDPPPLLYREPPACRGGERPSRARRAAVAAGRAAEAGGEQAREAISGGAASPTGRRAPWPAPPEGQPPLGGGAAREAIQMAAWSEDAWEFDEQPRNPFLVETLPRAARPMTVRLVAGTLLGALLAILAAGLTFLAGWPGFFGGV